MARTPMTLSELEGHFCCYEWQNASRGPSASAELFVYSFGKKLVKINSVDTEVIDMQEIIKKWRN